MSRLKLLYPVHSLHNQMLPTAGIAIPTVVLDALTSSGWTASVFGTVNRVVADENEECLPPDDYDNTADQFPPVRFQVTQ